MGGGGALHQQENPVARMHGQNVPEAEKIPPYAGLGNPAFANVGQEAAAAEKD
jgi:hypothetical protein